MCGARFLDAGKGDENATVKNCTKLHQHGSANVEIVIMLAKEISTDRLRQVGEEAHTVVGRIGVL